MKASDPPGSPAPRPSPRWLLIGNSRWHWADGAPPPGALQCWHTSPSPLAGDADLAALQGWAAVGPLPAGAPLDPARRLGLERVPLQGLPPWLGVDRALVAWRAWQLSAAPVLVADAGTALSLTLVDGQGRFVGGRLQAGLALQLRALAAGTAQLPAVDPGAWARQPGAEAPPLAADPWPQPTAAALQVGIRQGLVAAVAAAWRQAGERCPGCQLWITGGDSDWLAPALGLEPSPALALEALALLSAEGVSSAPDR